MKILEDNKILLCRAGSCCPLVERDGDNIYITDDYGNKVEMKFEEFAEIPKALDEFNKING